jgi:hypothetical protein
MIIGVSGFSGSGKDTVADTICKDPSFIKLAFADGIKRILQEVFDFTYDQLWGPSATRNKPDERYPRKDSFLTPRHALQSLGTEWGRDCYENVWVDLAIRMAKRLDGSSIFRYSPTEGMIPASDFALPTKGVLITDCRFRNELEGIRAAGGKIVRVLRKGLDTPPYGHSSETEQAGIPDSFFDHVFHNDGSLEDLPLKCTVMLKELVP